MSLDFYMDLFDDVSLVILGIFIPFFFKRIKNKLQGKSASYKLTNTKTLSKIEIIAISIWLTGCITGLLNYYPFDIFFYLAGYAIFMINFSLKDGPLIKSEAVLISVFSFLTMFLSFLSAIIYIHITS